MADVPYQQSTQVEQLRGERANAEALGQDSRVEAVDKQLAGLGVRMRAAERRQAAAEQSGEPEQARDQAPQGRTPPPRATADDTAELRQQAADLGVKVDGRWSAERLREEIAKARKS